MVEQPVLPKLLTAEFDVMPAKVGISSNYFPHNQSILMLANEIEIKLKKYAQ
jgi:hypothetical protein